MNENIKKRLIVFLLIACIALYGISRLQDNGRGADAVRDSIQRATDGAREQGQTIDDAKQLNRETQETADQLERNHSEIRESEQRTGTAIERGQSILQEIRRRGEED